MKKILITGANSYIGDSVKEYLEQFEGYQVDIKETLNWVPETADFNGYDVVFNVAGVAHRKETKVNRELYYTVNRDLAISIAERAREAGVKQFIQMSTMSVYGKTTGFIDKKTKPHPVNNYGKSKLEADRVIWKMRNGEFRIAVLRPPMVYGKGCKGNYQSLRKLAIHTPIFPKVDNKRSMIYIGNLGEFVKKIIDENEQGLFFPQNEEYVNTSNFVMKIRQVNGKNTKLILANWIDKVNIPIVQKVFGTLTYNNVERGGECDLIGQYSFDESVRLSEDVVNLCADLTKMPLSTKYSVLMPLYYKENLEHLKLSLISMMTQTEKPDEIVMIQDHVIPDEMKSLIETLSREYKIEVNIYENFELDGKGLSAVLKYGVCKCRNELIARMDSDDISLPIRCERELYCFKENPNFALVGSWVDEFDTDYNKIVTVHSTPETMDGIKRRFKVTNPFNHPTVMYRKSAILNVGNYDENSVADEDYELWYRLIKNGYEATNIQESLVKFRRGNNFSKRRRTKDAFHAKTEIKRRMLKDGFMSPIEYLGTFAVECIYLYFPLDIRKILFDIEKRKLALCSQNNWTNMQNKVSRVLFKKRRRSGLR